MSALAVLIVLTCSVAFGDLLPIANVSISADFPSSGVQELDITNETGPANGCNSYYLVCDALSIENWTLTVSYTSSYYNVTGPSLASPYVAKWQSGADDILPTAPLAFDFDLCGSNSVPDCSSPTTTITQIDFSGTLDQSSFTIYDPTANGGAGGPGPTFFANPSFSVVLQPSPAFPGDYFESQDAFVSNQSVVPEPQFKLFLIGMLAVLGCFHFRRLSLIPRS